MWSCFEILTQEIWCCNQNLIWIFPLKFMDFSCFNYVCKWMMSLFCLICMHTHVFSLFTRKRSYLLGWNAPHHVYSRFFWRWCEMHRDLPPRPLTTAGWAGGGEKWRGTNRATAGLLCARSNPRLGVRSRNSFCQTR